MTQKAGTLFLVLGMTMICSVSLAADTATGAQFEKRIYNIYKSNGLAPVGDQEWSAIVGQAQVESYVVRKGDTLWGLSAAFFGDGLYWPKIWSLNDRITNPHLIYPSAEIRFSSGTLDQPPGVQVVGKETLGNDGAPLEGPELVDPTGEAGGPEEAVAGEVDAPVGPSVPLVDGSNALYPGAPSLPPSRSQPNPVGVIPPAFAVSSFSVERFDESGVSFDVRPPPPVASRLFAHSFFYEGREKDYPSEGQVLEIEDGQDSVGFSGLVYLETDSESSVGSTFTVIAKDFPKTVNGVRGTVFRYSGVVQIVEALGSTRYRARVISALFPIPKGALLTKEVTPSFDDGVGARNSDRFEVEAGAYNTQRDLFGEGSVVFVGGGREDGVRIDDVFGIYKNRKVRYIGAQVDQSPRPIAAVKVFRLGERTSSALIISASEPVRVGDFTGSLSVGAMNISSGEREDIDALETELDASSEGPTSDIDGDNLTLDDLPDDSDDFGEGDEEDLEGDLDEDFGDENFDDFEDGAEGQDLLVPDPNDDEGLADESLSEDDDIADFEDGDFDEDEASESDDVLDEDAEDEDDFGEIEAEFENEGDF